MRLSRDRRSFPRKWERALTGELPELPAAVRLYGPEGTARCLAADFDVSRGGVERVEADAAAFAALVRDCGGRVISDVSPNGGRHVYVLWAAPVPFGEQRRLAQALAVRFPSLDPSPLINLSEGCIRPPGSLHKGGGYQRLTVSDAAAAVAHPNGPAVWNALFDALTPQLHTLDEPGHEQDQDAERAYLPRPGGPVPLTAKYEDIARTGVYDTARYASPSEARQAVLASAAARGHRLPDLWRRIETGAWPGLASFYVRYRRGRRAAIARDWRKAVDYASRLELGRNSHTRAKDHRGGGGQDSELQAPGPAIQSEGYRWIRAWWNAMLAAERDRYGTRAGQSTRRVLRALGAMAQRNGSRHLEVGTRSLALASGLDHSTVAAVLRGLRTEADPPLVLLEDERGIRGDLYELRIPDGYASAAAWRRWRAGRIEAIHPVFRELGGPAAFVYEALSATPAMLGQLRRAAQLSATATSDALRELAAYGLAENTTTGWRRGRTALDTVADLLGMTEVVEALIARYRLERAAWAAVLGIVRLPRLRRTTGAEHGDQDQAHVPPDVPAGEPPPEEPLTVLELLWRELGAVPIPA